jgi:hypothetical protein
MACQLWSRLTTVCHLVNCWLTAAPVFIPKAAAAPRCVSPACRTKAQAAAARASEPRLRSIKLARGIAKTAATVVIVSSMGRHPLTRRKAASSGRAAPRTASW